MSKAKTALIVIDVQNYFVDQPQLTLVKKIAEHIQERREDYVLFTQFINRPGTNFERILEWKKCVESPDIDIHPLLTPFTSNQNIFLKTSFSAFKSEALREFLIREGVTKLYLCGLDTDACVLASAYEAFDLGYDFEVIKELCSIHHPHEELHNVALKIIQKNLSREKTMTDHPNPNPNP